MPPRRSPRALLAPPPLERGGAPLDTPLDPPLRGGPPLPTKGGEGALLLELRAELAESNAKLSQLIGLFESHSPNLLRSFTFCIAICIVARLLQDCLLRYL